MDKENMPPLLDGHQMIEYIGVSKRLGNNVLQELEQRASNLLPNVSPEKTRLMNLGHDSEMKNSISMKFQDKHEKRFQVMDSIDTHYSLAKYSGMPQTPGKRKNGSDADETSVAVNLGSPGSVKKKQKSVGNVFSPVTDITHRIRRLRVRITTPNERERTERDRRRNIISNTPLSRQRQLHESIPTFAQPTATSLKRKQMNNPLHKLVASDNNNVESQPKPKPAKPRHGDIFRNLNQSEKQASHPRSAPVPKQQRIPQSKSVFERLYEQSTISRSNSSKNLLKQEKTTSSDGNTSQIPRSKTQHDLHGGMKNARLTKSTTLQNVALDRPQWR